MQKKPNLMDYQKQGLDITKAQFDITKATPNENEPYINAIKGIQEDSKTKRSTGDIIADGVLRGAQLHLEKKDVDKKTQFFDWLKQNIASMKQKNDWFEKKEQDRMALEPYASASLQAMYSNADYNTIDNNMRSIFNHAKNTYPELVTGEYVGFIPNTNLINFREKGEIFPMNLADISPDTAKMQQENQLKQLGLGIQQQNADAYGRSVQSNVDLHNAQIEKIKNQPPESPEDHYTIEYKKGLAKKALDIVDTFPKDTNQLISLKEAVFGMRNALKGGAFTNDGTIQSSLRNWFGEKLGTKGFVQTQNFDISAKTLLENIKQTFGGRITDADLKVAMKYMIPGQSWSKPTIEKFLNEIDHVISVKGNRLKKIDKLVKENNGTLPIDYAAKLSDIDVLDEQDKRHKEEKDKEKKNSPISQSMVKVQDPSTGEIMQLSPQNAEIALSRGGVRVQ